MSVLPLMFVVLAFLLPSLLAKVDVSFTREDFPQDFIFGAGTSSYQYEGAVAKDGRSPNIWDTFLHSEIGQEMLNGSTADISADGYHKFKEDIVLMHQTGLEAYRLSISWSRLIPNGRGEVNPKGLEYYNNVIDELVKMGIQPHVTFIHIDYPQVLEDEYHSWLSRDIVEDFTAFADVCFREFGDRVSYWTTINEPNVVLPATYDYGFFPPNRCSSPFGIFNCTDGDSTVETYIAMHHVLLAHASVVRLYRAKYQAVQKGQVGFNLYSMWFSPFNNSTEDADATKRAFDFTYGWLLEPLMYGDYPKVMKENAGSRLPSFSEQESELLKGAFDFVGLNHYVTLYVHNMAQENTTYRDYAGDLSVAFAASRDTEPIPGFLPVGIPPDPLGLEYMLEYIKLEYNNPSIYIQENGLRLEANSPDALEDIARIEVIENYLFHTLAALRNGTDVRGYFVWSFLDVFEFFTGYESVYGLYHVDFKDKNKKRRPKSSAFWYRDFITKSKKIVRMKNAELDANLHNFM